MVEDMQMLQLWPTGNPGPMDDEALMALYEPTRPAPTLRVNFVTSVDGAVEVDGRSAGLGSVPDRRVFDLLRVFADALMVGAGTLRQESYNSIPLDEKRRARRSAHGRTPDLPLVIVSKRLDLDPTQRILASARPRPIILTSSSAPTDRRTALSAVADVIAHGDDGVDLVAGMAELRSRGLMHILCEGGPHLFGSLTAADLVDEVCLTVSPLLAGAGAGRITAGPSSGVQGLRLAHALYSDDVLLLRYLRNRMNLSDARRV